MPGAARGRLRGLGDLPPGEHAGSRARGDDRRGRDPPLPADRGDRGVVRVPARVRGGALALLEAGSPPGPVRRRPHLQPAGSALPRRAAAQAARRPLRSSTSTTSCPSSTCRASAAARTCSTARVVALERLTYRVADVVIATNESYRRAALERGGKAPGASLRRPQRARPRPLQRRRPRRGAEAGQAAPALLPRRHGPAGRRRLRAALARRAARRCGRTTGTPRSSARATASSRCARSHAELGLRGPRHVHRPDPGRGAARAT